MDTSWNRRLSRRRFLKTSAAASALAFPVIAPRSVLGANETVQIGSIGATSMNVPQQPQDVHQEPTLPGGPFSTARDVEAGSRARARACVRACVRQG